ncbi:hypothetical protein D3C71_2017530 [compost metagenome]
MACVQAKHHPDDRAVGILVPGDVHCRKFEDTNDERRRPQQRHDDQADAHLRQILLARPAGNQDVGKQAGNQ